MGRGGPQGLVCMEKGQALAQEWWGRGQSGVRDPTGRLSPVRRQGPRRAHTQGGGDRGLYPGCLRKGNCCLQPRGGPRGCSYGGKGPTWTQCHSHRLGGAGSRGKLRTPHPHTPRAGSRGSETGGLGDSFLSCSHHSPLRQEHGGRGASMGERRNADPVGSRVGEPQGS